MPAATYYDFVGFFPTIDKDEATKLIQALTGGTIASDIFLLAAERPIKLADAIDDPDVKGKLAETLRQHAADVLNTIEPVDPDAPTQEEAVLINGGLDLLYSAWPDIKHRSLDILIRKIIKTYNIDGPYK